MIGIMTLTNKRYATLLLILFLVIWTALAIDPLYRNDWLLENILTVITLFCLIYSYKYIELRKVSYSLIFIFLCFHTLGSHYTYSEVPYDDWFVKFTGVSLGSLMGWERNQFDRLVHFLYGLILVYPIQDLVMKTVKTKFIFAYVVSVLIVMSSSMVYELIEWGVAELLGGDLGVSYLGIQG